MITEVIRNIFRINLNIKKSERVLIFSDRPNRTERLAVADHERRSKLRCIVLLASEIGRLFAKEIIVREFPATGNHGAEPPLLIWESAFGTRAVNTLTRKGLFERIRTKRANDADLIAAERIIQKYKKDAVHAVIALSNYSTSHTRFRDLLTRICLTRYASMPLFELGMFEGPMNIDWKQLDKITRDIARRINRAVAIDITTGNGSTISFATKGRKATADTGILRTPGAFGNLPAGEVYLAPVEGTAQGRLVLEWAPTRELTSPVTLDVRDGYVTAVSGKEAYVSELRKKLKARKENSNIAELGIGTNGRAKRPDNILESEKILGTIHIAFGDNSSFGGNVKTPFHQDYVFFQPTVTLIRKDNSKEILMKKGRLV